MSKHSNSVILANQRDLWIQTFKSKWDDSVSTITSELEESIDVLELFYVEKKTNDILARDREIKNINDNFLLIQKNDQIQLDLKKEEIKKLYDNKLDNFLRSNLQPVSFYDSVCNYILNFTSSEKVIVSTDFP